MDEKKELRVSLNALFLVIIAIAIIIMGYLIYNTYINNQHVNQKISELEATIAKSDEDIDILKNQINNMQSTLDSIRNQVVSSSLTAVNPSDNATANLNSTEEKSEENIVKDIVTEYIKAINDRNWSIINKYSRYSSTKDTISNYNISNCQLSIADYEYINNSYIFRITYDCSVDKKDVGLGGLLVVEKLNGEYKIQPFCTGY